MDEETTRLYFHGLLEATFPDVEEVYFRPPGDMLLERPCVVYTKLEELPSFSNNNPYLMGTRYQVTILSDLPGFSDTRRIYNMHGTTVLSHTSYPQNDVVHDVYTISINSL